MPDSVLSQSARAQTLLLPEPPQQTRRLHWQLRLLGLSGPTKPVEELEVSASNNTYLVVLIEPEEGKVGDSNRLPTILHLLASAVNDVGHLVSHYEFQVL